MTDELFGHWLHDVFVSCVWPMLPYSLSSFVCCEVLAISGFNGNGLLGIHSIRLPRLCVSRPLVSCDDVLDFVLKFSSEASAGNQDVRDAELVCIFDLLAELGRGRRHVRRDATERSCC